MVDPAQMAKISYDVASHAIRGVYDSAIDGASDLADDALESAKNSLTFCTELLHHTFSSAYTEITKVPDVISDVLFGITNIPSRVRPLLDDPFGLAKRHLLDPAWDTAKRAGCYVWDNVLPDIPGIDIEQTAKSLLAGVCEFLFGSEEQQPLVTLQPPTDIFVDDEEVTQKVVAAGIDSAGTEAARVRITRLIIVQPGSLSSSAEVTSTSSSAPTTELGSGSAVVISSLPPPAEEVSVASALATVAAEVPVVGNTPEGSTVSDTGGVEASAEESATNVFQTILNFFTGTSDNASSTSSNSTQNASAIAQTAGGLGVFGIAGSNGSTPQSAPSFSPVSPAYHVLPVALSRVFGDSGGPLTLGEAIYRVLTGTTDPSEITSQALTGLSTTRTLFYAVPIKSGSRGPSILTSLAVTPNNSAIIDPAELAAIADVADLSDVPFPGLPSFTLSTGRIVSDVAQAFDTHQIASGLSANVSNIHSKFDANAQSGSQHDDHNGYENVRDAELASNLNKSPSQELTVYPPFIIRGSNPASVAV